MSADRVHALSDAMRSRQADRQGYLDHTRYAENLRSSARAYRRLAEAFAPDEVRYGPAAADVAAGMAERFRMTLATFLDYQADQMQAIADDLRAHLDGER